MDITKKDIKVIIVCILIGGLLIPIFPKIGDISMTVITMYVLNKYGYKIDSYKDKNVIYKNKEEYMKSIDKVIKYANIYCIVKIIITLFTDIYILIDNDVIIVYLFVGLYMQYKSRKYIDSVDGEKINEKLRFLNNKYVIFIMIICFGVYTNNYFKDVNYQLKNNMKSPHYEYSIDNKNGYRVINYKGNGVELEVEETKENTMNYDTYINDIKNLMKFDYLDDYINKLGWFIMMLIIAEMIFMVRYKNGYSKVVVASIIMWSLLISVDTLTYSYELENKVTYGPVEEKIN